MKKSTSLIVSGVCLILAGITILLSESIGIGNVKIITPILFALSGVFNIVFSRANKALEIISRFLFIKGVGLLIFAIVISSLSDSLVNFLMYVTYFILMYGVLEIIFPFSILNSKLKIEKELISFSFIAGIVVSIGAIILLLKTLSDENTGLQIGSVLTILIGISNIIYALKLKGKVEKIGGV